MENTRSEFTGDIVLERVRGARPVRSFIAKKIFGWLKIHGIGASEKPHYRIALNRDGYGHTFTCQVEVHTQGSHWSSMQSAPDLHQAILSALNHLVIVQRRNYATQT
jgi:hypothetical protein